jgi:beta-glucanase (GH16 family)
MVKNNVKRIKYILSTSFALTLTVVLVGCGGAATNTDIKSVDVTSPVEDWVMVWNDEFDSASIDSSKWSYEVNCDGGGNNEQQCYTDSSDNSFLADGNLNIVALQAEEGAAKPFTSARMVTQYKADFKYGRFEMRAKLPQGQGTWPAFWMMPTDSVYGEWPKSGEIDIMEAVNLKVTDAEGNEEAYIHGTLHYGQEWPNNSSSGKGILLPDGTNPADGFHTYTIEWQEGEIRWYVDDYLYQTQMMSEVKFNSEKVAIGLKHRGWFAEYFDIISGELESHWDSAPFDQEFFMILNLAVGGDWPANVNDTGIDESAFENGQSYEVDYVRVYECASDPITGKGCETIRVGYKNEATDDDPTGALVIGKAPIPSIPSTDVPDLVTLYDDAIADGLVIASYNPDGVVSFSEIEEAGRGNVIELVKVGAAGSIFFTADPAYDLTGYGDSAELVFDMNVTSLEAGVELLVKFDSGWPNVSDVSVTLPTTGEWAEVRINMTGLLAAGNRFAPGSAADAANVVNLVVFEPLGAMTVKFDNVRLESGASGQVAKLYEDGLSDDLVFDSYNPDGSISYSEIDEDTRGKILEVVKTGATGNVYFTASPAYDLTSYNAFAELVFDVNVASLDAGVELIVKFDSGWPNVSDYTVTLPTTGEWAEVRINVQKMLANGNRFAPGNFADEVNVANIFVIEPTGAMTVKFDNIRLENPPEPTIISLYADAPGDGLMFDSYNPDSAIAYSQETSDDRGSILQVVKTAANGNVYINASEPYDISKYGANSDLVFDLNVISMNDGVELLIKLDSGWPNVSDISVTIPPLGEWTEVRLNILALLADENAFSPGSFADSTSITNVFVIDPTGAMTVQFDNIRFEDRQ